MKFIAIAWLLILAANKTRDNFNASSSAMSWSAGGLVAISIIIFFYGDFVINSILLTIFFSLLSTAFVFSGGTIITASHTPESGLVEKYISRTLMTSGIAFGAYAAINLIIKLNKNQNYLLFVIFALGLFVIPLALVREGKHKQKQKPPSAPP